MTNLSGPIPHHVPTTPHYSPQHTGPASQPARRRGRHRAARPYLASLPEPETLVLPVITEDMEPPAPVNARAGRHRRTGPWPKHPGRAAPADDMADLAALTWQLIAQRPDLAHPGSISVRAAVDPR